MWTFFLFYDMLTDMKNIISIILITSSICAALAGCGTDTGNGMVHSKALQQGSVSIIEEVTALPDAEIIIPAGLVGDEITDDSKAQAEDDSENVTFSLTGEERTQIVNEISKEVEDSIASILSDKETYPNIISITPNADCTESTISLNDGQMNTYESMLVLSFFTAGNKHQIYCGTPADEAKTIVKYVNSATGEIVSESDSTLMNTQ